MACMSLTGSKIALAFCNFLLLASGFMLVTGGVLVLFDDEKILLSKLLSTGPFSDLSKPFMYYLSIGIALLGLVLSGTGMLGCWATCLHNYWLLTVYFFLVMVMLIGECAVYVVAWIWPQCVGLGLDAESLVKVIQRNYGVSEQEEFTAAVDLTQTMFECCGINSANEYDMSLWRLQGLGQPLAVPLSCCILQNKNEPKAYLSPIPINISLCQALEKNRHEGYRYIQGCQNRLQHWYKEHYMALLGIGFLIVLIEFIVMLSSVLLCNQIYHFNQESKENAENSAQDFESRPVDYNNLKGNSTENRSLRNDVYTTTENMRQSYKLLDRA